ncbi:MAG: MFS transporter [Pseudomonadota bacterium]
MSVHPGKIRAISVLIAAQISVLSLWFSSAAVLAEMAQEAGVSAGRLAWMSTAVQLGFAGGALVYALLGLADRYDPRRVFCASALVGAIANLALLVVPIGGAEAVALRALTGAAMAGVYPVGMKIAVGWGKSDRGLLVGLLVGALTLGSASPHLIAFGGGADWRITIWGASLLAALGAVAILAVALGPYHARAPRLDPGAVTLAWTDRRLRLAILGYLGHMWELYAFWAWCGVIAAASFAAAGLEAAEGLAKLTAFLAIAAGGLACVPAGWLGDRIGCDRVAMLCLIGSGSAALLSAFAFGGPVWLMMGMLIFWGITIVPDSGQYSTLVANEAPPERAGSLMTLQTAFGFLLTAATVQMAPMVAEAAGWPILLALLSLGPLLGIRSMWVYRQNETKRELSQPPGT